MLQHYATQWRDQNLWLSGAIISKKLRPKNKFPRENINSHFHFHPNLTEGSFVEI